MSNRLQGKRVLITGAASGIGAATARAMKAEDAELILTDRHADAVASEAKAIGAVSMELDVTSAADWAAAAAEVERRWGAVDVLVNNAGMESQKSIEELSLEDWHRVMEVNLDSIFIGIKAMLPMLKMGATQARAHMGRRGSASVINISSVCGILAFGEMSAYNTSKAGVRHLSKSLAVEFGRRGIGIRVNSVHPGGINTPMLSQGIDRWVERNFLNSDDRSTMLDAIAQRSPLNMIGEPQDVALGVVYLAADEAAFITGTELVIDGGWLAE